MSLLVRPLANNPKISVSRTESSIFFACNGALGAFVLLGVFNVFRQYSCMVQQILPKKMGGAMG